MAGQAVTKPKAKGDKAQRYVLYLGLLLAGVAAVIVFAVVNGAGGGDGGVNTVPVVVANEAIPAETRLTAEHLKVEFFPTDEVNPDAFTSRSQLVDRVVTQDVDAGAQLLPSMVSTTAGDGLAFKVDPGMRGISVEVREVVTAGGNIKPGDKVDVVGVFEVDSVEAANHLLSQLGTSYSVSQPPLASGGEGEERSQSFVLTVTLLQNVKVLGLAQNLTPTTAGGTFADDAATTDTEPRAATATLEVTPDKAQMLTTADEYGILRMDARAVSDDATVEVQPTLIQVSRVQ